jgi:hypothetical protein
MSVATLSRQSFQESGLGERERLAAALEAVLVDAALPRSERSPALRICRAEVAVARGEILRVAERLRDPRPVHPCGVALVRRLLTDRAGPLYAASPNDELWRRLRRAAVELDHR